MGLVARMRIAGTRQVRTRVDGRGIRGVLSVALVPRSVPVTVTVPMTVIRESCMHIDMEILQRRLRHLLGRVQQV